MRINWCKILGHKWLPIIIGKKLNTYTFIACYCDRCNIGNRELHKMIEDYKPEINTYCFDFFREIGGK